MDLVYSPLSGAELQRLEVIQNKGMGSILGCTRDTSAEAMRYLLDLPPMPNRHKAEYQKTQAIHPTTKLANLLTVTYEEVPPV